MFSIVILKAELRAVIGLYCWMRRVIDRLERSTRRRGVVGTTHATVWFLLNYATTKKYACIYFLNNKIDIRFIVILLNVLFDNRNGVCCRQIFFFSYYIMTHIIKLNVYYKYFSLNLFYKLTSCYCSNWSWSWSGFL